MVSIFIIQKVINFDTSPSPAKKRKYEEKLEKKTIENQKLSPTKYKNEKFVL